MKKLIKTCIAAYFCFFCAIASATKLDSIRLAESLVTQTQFDVFVCDLVFDFLYHGFKSIDKVELEEFKSSVKEIYGDDIKKRIAVSLLESYSDQELREIKQIFEDERVRKMFVDYYSTWLTMQSEHSLFSKNIEKLIMSIHSTHHPKPKYIKHKHYGKVPINDPILNMLKVMDGLQGENAVDAYKPWAKEKKAKTMKALLEDRPELARHEKELSKIYDYSNDTWIVYWTLKENKKLDIRNFQAATDAMISNDAFRQFFVEIYNTSQQIGSAIEKDLKFQKWMANKHHKANIDISA